MNKEKYAELLDKHDWTFEFSDDHRWWVKGKNEQKELLYFAGLNEDFKKMYQEKRGEVL